MMVISGHTISPTIYREADMDNGRNSTLHSEKKKLST
mgnify:CR=1 FL=1